MDKQRLIESVNSSSGRVDSLTGPSTSILSSSTTTTSTITKAGRYNSIPSRLHEPSKDFTEKDNKEVVNRLKRSFYWFSVIASLNHALNYVVNAYSSTLLPNHLAGVTLGLNWSLNSVSGLTLATPAVRLLGFRNAMIISFWGYAFQIATLYLAIVQPKIEWPIGLTGAVVAGFTSAIWWTAQGVCFELTCNKINEYSGGHINSVNGSMNEVRSNLSAHWTIIYQCSDILVFLTLSVIPLLGNISINAVLLALTFLGIITAILGFTLNNLGDYGDQFDMKSLYSAIAAVPYQFGTDCRATLLAPFVFGFGITTAMFSYYLNDKAISSSNNLGTLSLGFLEAFSYLIATISAYPYAYISNRYSGGRHFVIQFGSLSFLLSGAVVLMIPDSQLGTWKNILIIKALYGLGRGVFEGSCRAVYAELFVGNDLSTAFSAQTLLAGLSGGICYFIYGELTRDAIAYITVGNGIIAIIFYGVMLTLNYHEPQSWKSLGQRLCSLRQVNLYDRMASTSMSGSGTNLRTYLLDPSSSSASLSGPSSASTNSNKKILISDFD